MRPDGPLFLCANLMTELYAMTGNSSYLRWADLALDWGMLNLYDPQNQLFYWYRAADNALNTSQFAYSNAIAANAWYRFGKATNSSSALELAANISSSIYRTFWSTAAQAFIESTLVTWAVSTTLSGWASKSLLPIALATNSSDLLQACCLNAAFIQNFLLDPWTGGFYDSAFVNGQVPPSNLDYFTTLNSAWGQWLATLLSPFCPSSQ